MFEHHTLLNTQRLDDVTGGDPVVKQELLTLFRQDLSEGSQELLESLAQEAMPAARHAAHTLKAKALYLGAIRVAKLCEALERHCQSGELPLAQSLLPEFEGTVKALRTQLSDELAVADSEKDS